MWQAILGAVGALAVSILGFLFHIRGDKIKSQEQQIEELEKQSDINDIALETIKEGQELINEIAKTDADLDSLIDAFNNGDRV